MDRREFVRMLAAGTLLATLTPTVAQAFTTGQITEDELFDLLQDGGYGLVTQEATVVARVGATMDRRGRHIGNIIRPLGTDPETVTMTYRITGEAEEKEFAIVKDQIITEEVELTEAAKINRRNAGLTVPDTYQRVVGWAEDKIEIHKRKFIPGHRVNADGSEIPEPVMKRVGTDVTKEWFGGDSIFTPTKIPTWISDGRMFEGGAEVTQ